MKGLIAIIFSLCCLSTAAFGQTTAAMSGVQSGIRSGNANAVVRYAGARVDLTLQGNSSRYSKAQAEMILKDFFSRNAVKEFLIQQNGRAGNNYFSIGELSTANGKYRIYIAVVDNNGSDELHEIRIE